jgi:hypothetical protein
VTSLHIYWHRRSMSLISIYKYMLLRNDHVRSGLETMRAVTPSRRLHTPQPWCVALTPWYLSRCCEAHTWVQWEVVYAGPGNREIWDCIVTDWAVARRRIGKHVPTNPHPTIEGRPLLGNISVNTYHSNDCATTEILFSMVSAPRSYLEDNCSIRYVR